MRRNRSLRHSGITKKRSKVIWSSFDHVMVRQSQKMVSCRTCCYLQWSPVWYEAQTAGKFTTSYGGSQRSVTHELKVVLGSCTPGASCLTDQSADLLSLGCQSPSYSPTYVVLLCTRWNLWNPMEFSSYPDTYNGSFRRKTLTMWFLNSPSLHCLLVILMATWML